MKNFTLAIIIALGFGFSSQAQVQREIKVTEMVSPLAGGTIAANFVTQFTFVIQNSGAETIAATDTILVGWGDYDGSQVHLKTPVYMLGKPHKVLAPNDTIHFTIPLKITGAGTVTLAFLASYSALLANFKGIVVQFTSTTGIDEQAKAINNVWFSNNSLNYELVPKATCKATLNILNMNGQIIENQALNLTAGKSMNESISLGTLPKGIYILSVQTPFGVDTKKFVVQ